MINEPIDCLTRLGLYALMALVGTGLGCGRQDAAGSLGKHVAPATLPVEQGSLYVANCELEKGAFVCRQYLMRFDPTQATGIRTVELGPVVQVAASAAAVTVKAAVVDPARSLAYLHGGCTGSYIVTDLKKGSATVFPLPQGMQCLQSLVVDDSSGDVLVLLSGCGKVPSDTAVPPSVASPESASDVVGGLPLVERPASKGPFGPSAFDS
jgi:hypothetical protein